jgi:hypothetical protein
LASTGEVISEVLKEVAIVWPPYPDGRLPFEVSAAWLRGNEAAAAAVAIDESDVHTRNGTGPGGKLVGSDCELQIVQSGPALIIALNERAIGKSSK